ncbi:S24 family peptidase [Aliivibrio fischeri]|uniref:S24 family peptidase n=1 Tax=Aliivibrio fischeri TaxID=668 RepID=UPI0007C48D88|nr:S24 family peptidase [Aliivibrio fischeri]MBP3140853.1 transcriptional regulator [Aliivibrio fischeri]MBP3155840.1 transcriptional regulator [Aliivibrio fischeri]MCE7575310.1 transcriptional regulator [Aliivibrio fischeri]
MNKSDIDEIKQLLGVEKDNDLAKVVNVTPSAVSKWKSRGEVPAHVMEKARKGGFNSKNISLRLYDISASAGAGALVEYEPSIEVELGDTLKIALGINHPSKAKMLHVQGDSMSPTLQSNSLIAIEEVDSFSDDGIYVFTWDNDLFVKRLQRTKAGIKVISDNTVYEPWEILSDEMRGEGFIIRGRVTGCCQHL